MRRPLLTVFCVAICSGVMAQGAVAKPKGRHGPTACDGLLIKRAEMVTDQGQIGVLDGGDVFALTFQRPFFAIFAPGTEAIFLAADGQRDSISNPNGTLGYTVTSRKSVTVNISEIDLGGGPNDIALPLPVSITNFSQLVDKNGNAIDSTVSTCSRDAVLG